MTGGNLFPSPYTLPIPWGLFYYATQATDDNTMLRYVALIIADVRVIWLCKVLERGVKRRHNMRYERNHSRFHIPTQHISHAITELQYTTYGHI